MKNFITRLREDSRFLLLVAAVLAILVLAFFAFWAGLVLLFIVGFFIWIVFSLFYLRFLYDYSYIFRLVVLLCVFIATAFLIVKLLG